MFRINIYELAKDFSNITIDERPYSFTDIEDADIVIAAVNDITISEQIRDDAHRAGKLVNVADNPELCDFYLSSVVKKGDLKIAISTNGKSPTVAKRLKEQINEMMPDEIENVLENMHVIRNGLNGDFASKVKHLNEITNVSGGQTNYAACLFKIGNKAMAKNCRLVSAGFFLYDIRPWNFVLHSFQ